MLSCIRTAREQKVWNQMVEGGSSLLEHWCHLVVPHGSGFVRFPRAVRERYTLSCGVCACVWLCSPVDWGPPGSSVHGISWQEYWSGWPCPPPGDLPNPGIEPSPPAFPVLRADYLPVSHRESPTNRGMDKEDVIHIENRILLNHHKRVK